MMSGPPPIPPRPRRAMFPLNCFLMVCVLAVAIFQYSLMSHHPANLLDTGESLKTRLRQNFAPDDDSSFTTPPNRQISTERLRSPAFANSTTRKPNTTNSKYAYAFIVGSVHESKKAYRGFLFNVLCAVQVLREFGSEADFVAYLQPSPNSTLTSLPEEDVRWLKAMNIRIITLDKPAVESFADLMFDKFRIFQLTEYKRVIYLDSDILPVNSLDYLFHLSDPEDSSTPTPLRPNLMQASGGEPANGGMFMVQPFEGAWEQVQAVIARQRQEGKSLPYPNFSRGTGWGHVFKEDPHDSWHAAKKNGTTWNFHGAHADQGLLYYFMRFALQDVSHVVGRTVENWGSKANQSIPYNMEAHDNLLSEYSQKPFLQAKYCYRRGAKYRQRPFDCYPPYRDYAHFTGRRKPWQNPMKDKWLQSNLTSLGKNRVFTKYWFLNLRQLNERLECGLDLARWNEKYLPAMQESPLGYLPLYSDNSKRIMENETPPLD